MRVAIDAMLLQGRFSGVEWSILNLLRALGAYTDKHNLVGFVPGNFDAELMPEGIQIQRGPAAAAGRVGRILWEQMRLPGLLTREEFDILHAPGYVMPWRLGIPAVLTVYDILALTHPRWCKASNAWHYGLMMPRSIRRAARVVVPSAYVASQILKCVPNMPEDKLRVVPLGVESAFRPATPDEVEKTRDRYQLTEPYLLCVGNIEPKKNLIATVQALEAVADCIPHRLVIAGAMGWRAGKIMRRFQQVADRLPGRILHLGYVPQQSLAALYTGAELCIHWSLFEGFGLVPLEAMACGTPVIASDQGALPEVAGDAAEVVPIGEPAALGEAIVRLVSDEGRRQELVSKGLERSAMYSWARHASEVVKIYEEVGGESGRA